MSHPSERSLVRKPLHPQFSTNDGNTDFPGTGLGWRSRARRPQHIIRSGMNDTSSRRNWMAAILPIIESFRNKAGASCHNSEALRAVAQPVLNEAVRKGELPGLAAFLSQNKCDPIVIRSGWRNVQKRLPVREDSIFDIRSITKPVTAIAALILVQNKRLDLDSSITDMLPGARSSTWANEVTLRHLLTHTSGLGQQRPRGLDDLTESRDRRLDVVAQAILDSALTGKAGSWQYSSLGYCLVGRIVEVASGMPFAQFVTDAVLHPLRMFDTSFLPPLAARNRMANLYQWKYGALVPWPRNLPTSKWVYDAPDFGLYSTVKDLARLLLAVSSSEFPLFRNSLRTEMLSPTIATDVPGLGQGFGWMIAQSDEIRGSLGITRGCFGHNGSGGSMAWANPATSTAAVLLTQCFFNESAAGERFMRIAFNSFR